VQKEIRWAWKYKKKIIVLFEKDQRRAGFFDHGEAWGKYHGTEWEAILNIDAEPYQRDEGYAQGMVQKILRHAEGMPAVAAAVPALNVPGSWDLFISHAQATGGDQVQTTSLRLKGAGQEVWYDNAMLDRSTAAMEEGVKHSRCFVLFLTGDAFLTSALAAPPIAQNRMPSLSRSWSAAPAREDGGDQMEPEPETQEQEQLSSDEESAVQDLLEFLSGTIGLKEKKSKPFLRAYAVRLVEEGCDSVEELLSLSSEELQREYGFKKHHAGKVEKHVASPRTPDSAAITVLPAEPAACQALMQQCLDEWQQGRWQLEELLGRGGSGVVYRAADRNLDTVALKLTAMDPDRRRKATREAVILQKVRHPNVCTILDTVHELKHRGIFAIVLEFMNRGSLATRLMAQGGRLEQREVVTMAFEVLQALAHVHAENIIHRDVKPANILRHRGEEGIVHKLGDFGIAVASTKATDSSTTLQTRTVGLQLEIGTPLYMSPEQLKKGVSAGKPTDLWSTGVVMYQALTGRLPFGHEEAHDEMAVVAAIMRDAPTDPRDLTVTKPGDVDDAVAELVLRALCKSPADRFASASAMAGALEAALSSTGSEHGFDIFINYRVWCEKDFAGELFKAAEQLRIGSKQRRPRVYLDKVRLLDGQRFDIGFTVGLAQSLVFAPLLSSNCLKPFAKLGQEDRTDFVLVEYIMAFALHKRGIVKAIVPVVLNEQDDGTHTEAFFQQLLSGAVAEGEPFPDAVSAMSMAKAAEFLSQLPAEHGGPIELTPEERAQTVKGLVAELLKFQAALLHVDRAWDASGVQRTSSIRSTHGGSAREMTRAAVVQKLAERLIGTVEKCQAPAALHGPGDVPEPEQ
jgi:serine/threonine protein kinase